MSVRTNGSEYTPIQGRLMTVLHDGMPHTREELRRCLEDSEATVQNMQNHLSKLRKIINAKGLDVVCENRRGIQYRLVQLLVSAYDGVR